MEERELRELISLTEQSLLADLDIMSVNHGDPVLVENTPDGWMLLGAGNYAGVFAHRDYPDIAVKVYAPGREGWESEREVYRRIGKHPAYSACYHAGEHCGYTYLILKRLRGKTLYQCLIEGIAIPKEAIEDIDRALEYARSRGLYPHDVHGKNVMVANGRGIVVDISDFLKEEPCSMWEDLKRAYDRIYLPFMAKRPIPVPEWVMNGVRKGYRFMRYSSFLGRSS
ncbi:serine/threonine-protein kinase [Paenibacillus arenilitoris]|uniref:Serine/threonine protein kinase n=1 Tax=Paenibacillus arenilitoris TaxID=2772299 RepID=A0A927CHQ1_9BACL|nr:serine/threonine protein kinase [Paenibacillus arenilitoris]MBD2868304.1 serine/threonine protein kinase [Paenibacillus arenilitoris]